MCLKDSPPSAWWSLLLAWLRNHSRQSSEHAGFAAKHLHSVSTCSWFSSGHTHTHFQNYILWKMHNNTHRDNMNKFNDNSAKTQTTKRNDDKPRNSTMTHIQTHTHTHTHITQRTHTHTHTHAHTHTKHTHKHMGSQIPKSS
jgi:hypothetical protein